MKQRPVSLLLIAQGLALGTLLYSSTALAIPGTLLSTTGPDNDNPAAPGTDHTRSDLEVIASQSTNCQHDLASGLDVDDVMGATPCVDTTNPAQRFSIQLGRRIGERSEILGEFDGARLDYRLGGGLKLNGIAGYEMLASGSELNLARQVYGVSAETEPSVRTWNLSSYLLQQQEYGQVIDWSAGGAIRHMQPGRSMLVYLDYDVTDEVLGTLMTSGAWQLPFSTTISVTLDLHHRSIPLRQQNYLQHSMAVTEGWDWILPTERLMQHTESGTSQVSLLAGNLSHALSQRMKLSGAVVVLDAASDAHPFPTARSSEYFYHLKLTGKDLLIRGDRSKLDLRHVITNDGWTNTATLDTRFTIKRFWKLVSQLRADYSSTALESQSRWVASPKVAMEYRPNKQFGFQIEAGGNLLNGENPAADTSPAYFVSLNSQVNF
jgi:hypothetical protein